MTLDEFHKELSYVTASRENRSKYAHMVLNDMSLFPKLLSISLMVNDKTSSRASWVLEYVCNQYIYAIVPHLNTFTHNIGKVHFDSSVRPIAKVCKRIAKAYTSKSPNPVKKILTSKHKELIIESCFDWLINDGKVAAKVYAMETLFLLGKEYPWVYPQLVLILEQDFHKQSAAFKARAKHIFNRIRKHKNL